MKTSSVETRAPLSRERVLGAAVALADESGIEALSMRRLAQGLGVEAMSLYHWINGKDELLGGMLDVVFAEMELPATDGDWRSALRAGALSAHHVLLRHPWACNLLGSPTGPTPARLRWMNGILGRLRAAGFSPVLTHYAYHALDSHIVGYTLWLLPYLTLSRTQPDLAEQFLADSSMADLPHLAEHIGVHLAPPGPDDVNGFEFGLDLLLDGLERLRPGPGED
jgi:AcrR family transcriptional regulator